MGRRDIDRGPRLAEPGPFRARTAPRRWRVCAIDGACRILSLSPSQDGQPVIDLVGAPCQSLLRDEDHRALQEAIATAWHTGEPTRCEIDLLVPGLPPTRQTLSVLPLPEGAAPARALLVVEPLGGSQQDEPLRAIGTHPDVTERMRLEEALRRSEAQLHAIVDGTSDSVYVKDLQGRHLLVNRAARAALGRDAGELLGRDIGAITGTDWARAMMANDLDVLAAGRTMTVHETLVTPDGLTRTFLSTKGPVRDDSGATVGLFGISRDITELLQREAAQREDLARSRQLLELALSASELGTWDADLVTGTVKVDHRYAAMLGHGAGELNPTPHELAARVHPDDLHALTAAVQAHARGETRLCEVEYRLRHKEGHWVWVLDRGKCIRDEQGRPVRASGTTQDITERRQAAAEGVALVKQLERLIAGLNARPAVEALSPPPPPPGLATLGARSRQVLALVAEGLTSTEIGQRLHISPATASTHRRNLMRRLGVRNRAELIRLAVEHSITPASRHPAD